MKVIGKDRTSCDVCNPIDEILARLDALEKRASAIVAKVQGIAPDGEGNVTLPTSSSDTDPLHGRIDAFAMSSEVKEAADDAHAYAASIADDVIVINSEIDALNQAVAALQPAEIEAIKSAVQTLQTTVATLESTVVTLNNSVAGKVSKSGDTMTGDLIKKSTNYDGNDYTLTGHVLGNFQFNDKNDILSGYVRRLGTTQAQSTVLGCVANIGGSTVSSVLEASIDINGVAYGLAPSWSPGTNDNSDKVMTIKMANSLPSLVHTTGIETISGMKKFINTYWNVGGIAFQDPRYGISDAEKPLFNSAFKYLSQFPLLDKDNVIISNEIIQTNADNSIEKVTKMRDSTNTERTVMSVKLNPSDGGMKMILRSNTPSNATGTEVATAGWVMTKINELATKNNLAGL